MGEMEWANRTGIHSNGLLNKCVSLVNKEVLGGGGDAAWMNHVELHHFLSFNGCDKKSNVKTALLNNVNNQERQCKM